MKFIKVLTETYVSDVLRNIPVHINIENVAYIRELVDDSLNLFFVGSDKPMKISDKDSIKLIKKETKIKVVNE